MPSETPSVSPTPFTVICSPDALPSPFPKFSHGHSGVTPCFTLSLAWTDFSRTLFPFSPRFLRALVCRTTLGFPLKKFKVNNIMKECAELK